MRETLHVGGASIAVTDHRPGAPPLSAAAAGWFHDDIPSPDLTLEAQWGDTGSGAGGRLIFDSGGLWRLFDRDDRGSRFEFRSPAFGEVPYRVVEIDRGWSRGVVTLRESAVPLAVSPIEYPLDELLVTRLLARHGGVEVHACGIVNEGRGYLFVGHSGAGKSTMAKLWLGERSEVEVLSDDRIILGTEPDVRIWGTPWHGEAHLSLPASSRIDKIFILRQAPATDVRRLRPAEAAAALISRSFIPVYHEPSVARATETVATIVTTVPVFELSFRPDVDVVEAALSC